MTPLPRYRRRKPKIPFARSILETVLKDRNLDPWVRLMLRRALKYMYREPYKRRAKPRRQKIDLRMRRRIHTISDAYPDMTEHEIANAVGLRSSGRVSEVLHGHR